MATEALTFEIAVTGGPESAQAFENVQRKITQTAKAQEQFTATSTKASSASAGVAQSLGRVGSTLSLAGQSIGRFNAGAGQLVSILGQAAGTVTALGAGFGPLGLAVAGAVTVFGLLSSALDDSKKETAQLAETMRRQAIPALEELIGKAREAQEALTLRARLRQGRGTALEQGAFAAQLGDYVTEIETRAAIAGRQGNQAEQSRLEAEAMRARRDLAYRQRLTDEATQREADAAARRREQESYALELEAAEGAIDAHDGTRRRGGRGDAERERREQYRLLIGQERTLTQGRLGTHGESIDLGELEARQFDEEVERARRRDAEERQRHEEAIQYQREAYEGVQEIYERAAETRLRLIDEEVSKWEAAGETIGSTLSEAFAAAMSGQESLGKAILNSTKKTLQGIGARETVEAIAATAKGIGLSFESPPDAAAQFASAAKHAAAAVAAGVGAAAAGELAGGGGGGAGRGGAGGSTRPSPDRFGGGEARPTQVVINWNAQSIIEGSAHELGLRIADRLESSLRRDGRRLRA